MQVNSINKQKFGTICFKDETNKNIFLRNVVAPAIGEGDTDTFIKKYKVVDNNKDVKLYINSDGVSVVWHGVIDPSFIKTKADSEESLFSIVNEALNYIILHKELINMDKF